MQTEASFKVKMDAFEGPLDLLLSLIEKRKLHINDVSLSKVTDDYLEHLKKLENFPIPDSANFILVASTLVLLKSKSLLPTLELSEEEQFSIEELEERLRVYKILKEAVAELGPEFGRRMIFPKMPGRLEPVFAPANDLSLQAIFEIVEKLIANLPKPAVLAKALVEKVISLEEMIKNLTIRIQDSLKISFKEFSGKYDKREIIVSFLAMLELVKQGIVSVTQRATFDDIEIGKS